jgi:hypothetical protein
MVVQILRIEDVVVRLIHIRCWIWQTGVAVWIGDVIHLAILIQRSMDGDVVSFVGAALIKEEARHWISYFRPIYLCPNVALYNIIVSVLVCWIGCGVACWVDWIWESDLGEEWGRSERLKWRGDVYNLIVILKVLVCIFWIKRKIGSRLWELGWLWVNLLWWLWVDLLCWLGRLGRLERGRLGSLFLSPNWDKLRLWLILWIGLL